MNSIKSDKTCFRYIFLPIVIICLIGLGCAKRLPIEDVVVKVNDYSLSAAEFNELFSELKLSEDTPEVRKAFTEKLINRKLLLQEAQKLGLDKENDFLKSIENFWEYSLLSIIVDKKTKEVSSTIAVTDGEIQDYYNNWVKNNPDEQKSLVEMRDNIRTHLLRQKQALALNAWIGKLRENANIKVNRKALGIE